MTQTAAAPGAPAPARPAPAAPAPPDALALVPLGAVPPAVVTPTRNTPAQLRRLGLVVVASGVVVAVLGTVAMTLLTLTLRQGSEDVAQLVRVQKIETDLLVADANATNTFLVGGLESPQRRAAYDTALAEVANLVSESARAQPADAAALASLNADVLDYATLVEAARANNRQGLPVGAQYLREASNGLRSDALPVAEALVQANTGRADAALATGWGWAVPALAAAATVVLIVVQVRVARQFRRRINPGLFVASLVLALLTLSSAALMTRLLFTVDVSRGEAGLVELAGDARIQANLAKSSESLTLIARGSGQAYEQSWQTSAAAVDDELSHNRIVSAYLPQFEAYEQVHRQIRALDDGGSWDQAVALAVASDVGSSNAAFAPFDVSMADIVNRSGDSTVGAVRGEQAGLLVACVLTFLAGLGAAWSGRRGIAARQREYR